MNSNTKNALWALLALALLGISGFCIYWFIFKEEEKPVPNPEFCEGDFPSKCTDTELVEFIEEECNTEQSIGMGQTATRRQKSTGVKRNKI